MKEEKDLPLVGGGGCAERGREKGEPFDGEIRDVFSLTWWGRELEWMRKDLFGG